MARTYPQQIPTSTESMAERRLFEVFRRDLPNDWVVFHGVRWLARDVRRLGVLDGESDFIIAAPGRGLLAVEVKGGNI